LHDVLDLRSRRDLRLLRCDLNALGVLDPSMLRCTKISPFRGLHEALGWMFVVDHNAPLSGQVHTFLRTHLPRELTIAGSYLTSYDRSGDRRDEFSDALDRVARKPADAERITNAAKMAFRCQRFWYENRLRSTSPESGAVGVAHASPTKR
jgi:heme oxygenase